MSTDSPDSDLPGKKLIKVYVPVELRDRLKKQQLARVLKGEEIATIGEMVRAAIDMWLESYANCGPKSIQITKTGKSQTRPAAYAVDHQIHDAIYKNSVLRQSRGWLPDTMSDIVVWAVNKWLETNEVESEQAEASESDG